jgi:hypothetical protein
VRIQVTQELTGAWEVWQLDVPDDTDMENLSNLSLWAGVLVDSGNDSATITGIEQI